MRSPDVNVLVSAFREDAVHHQPCRAWLVETPSSRDWIGPARRSRLGPRYGPMRAETDFTRM